MDSVMKPVGKAVRLAWGLMDQPYFETTIGTVLRMMPGATLPESAKNMFAFGRPGSLAQRLMEASFTTVEEKFSKEPWIWPGSPLDVWEYFQDVAVPFASLLKSTPPELRNGVDAAVLEAITHYYDGQEIKITATGNITSASK